MMSQHPALQDLELYVMGTCEDSDAIESHISDCRDCSAIVRREARLELAMFDLAGRVAECPSCRRAAASDRCANCGAALRAGDYRIVEVVVQNAHGRLYLAEDRVGRRVALKELAFVQTPGLEAISAFEREVKFLRALAHPDIPRFVASFQEGEGVQTRLFLAQEYIDGESLHNRLADHWFDEDEVIGIARKVLEILVYLQELSPIVIHGDIKPANLIRRHDGSIALVDFGAARSFNATITTAVGTFGYMPIEQLAGIVNPSTDLYGLGASLVHLLAREEPWKILEDPAALAKLNVTPELRKFLAKLTARRPVDRFANARAAFDALARLRAPSARRRKPWLFAAIAAGGLATGAAGFAVAKLTSSDASTVIVDDDDDESRQIALIETWPKHAPEHSGDFVAIYGDAFQQGLASYDAMHGVKTESAVYLPIAVSDAIEDPHTGQWYVIDDQSFGTFAWPGTFHSLEVEPAPSLWNPSALAFDTKRRRIVIASEDEQSELHYLYAYSVDTKTWVKLADIGPLELDSLTYNFADDRLYGLNNGFLSVLDANGTVLKHYPVANSAGAQIVSAQGRLYFVTNGTVEFLNAHVTNFDFTSPAPPTCDADALKDKGMEMITMGQHAAALAQFEASLKCKRDSYVMQLAFMEACSSNNATKAKFYFKQLTPAQQNKFAQICIRQKVEYE